MKSNINNKYMKYSNVELACLAKEYTKKYFKLIRSEHITNRILSKYGYEKMIYSNNSKLEKDFFDVISCCFDKKIDIDDAWFKEPITKVDIINCLENVELQDILYLNNLSNNRNCDAIKEITENISYFFDSLIKTINSYDCDYDFNNSANQKELLHKIK